MLRCRIPLVLCLAFGAVSAEALAQSPLASLRIPPGPVLAGSTFPCRVSWPSMTGVPANVYVFVASSAGHSPVSVPGVGQTLILPLEGTIIPVAVSPLASGSWAGNFIVPSDPALNTCDSCAIAAAVVPIFGPILYSAAIPFGPIIEDSIN